MTTRRPDPPRRAAPVGVDQKASAPTTSRPSRPPSAGKPDALKDGPRPHALRDAVRSPSSRRWLGAPPGCDSTETVDVQPVE